MKELLQMMYSLLMFTLFLVFVAAYISLVVVKKIACKFSLFNINHFGQKRLQFLISPFIEFFTMTKSEPILIFIISSSI